MWTKWHFLLLILSETFFRPSPTPLVHYFSKTNFYGNFLCPSGSIVFGRFHSLVSFASCQDVFRVESIGKKKLRAVRERAGKKKTSKKKSLAFFLCHHHGPSKQEWKKDTPRSNGKKFQAFRKTAYSFCLRRGSVSSMLLSCFVWPDSMWKCCLTESFFLPFQIIRLNASSIALSTLSYPQFICFNIPCNCHVLQERRSFHYIFLFSG